MPSSMYFYSGVEETLKSLIKTRLSTLLNDEIQVQFTLRSGYKRLDVYVSATSAAVYVVRFSLSELPGCCGYLVSHNLRVCPEYRNRGVGKLFQEIKFEMAKTFGYTYLMCTTTQHNEVENHILTQYGWQQIHSGINARTSNQLYMWVKSVPRS